MYYNNHDVRVEELPEPEIGPGELLVKVEASGICGSDVMEWYLFEQVATVEVQVRRVALDEFLLDHPGHALGEPTERVARKELVDVLTIDGRVERVSEI